MTRARCARTGAVVVVVAALAGAGCGDAPLRATFTSRIVQLETCRTVGDAPEGCARDEVIAELRTDLVEVDDDTFWLYGLRRGGVDDRAILGTRDANDGFLFVDEFTERDGVTGCTVITSLELSLAVDPERVADVGDECVSLVGRQVTTSTSSVECDGANVPPQAVVRTVRQRWEPLDPSSTCGG
jgi:hypothetical protein